MESLLVSTLVVALAEIGDKTQLLAFLLAVRFRKPWPIAAGIIAATLANHFAAGAVGSWIAGFFSEVALSWTLAASFIVVALWILVPDKLGEEESSLKKYGSFLTTLITFFFAEMGDKTQIATVILAAQYPHFGLVVIGTTLGMLIANLPVVVIGNLAADKLPLALIRCLAASAFTTLGLYAAWHAIRLSGW